MKTVPGNTQESDNNIPTRTVLFVENTRNGELAKRLRAVEKRANVITWFRTKIVEGVRSKLKEILPLEGCPLWEGTLHPLPATSGEVTGL